MNWKTAMQTVKGILAGAGIIAGIAAVARSAAFGKALSGYLAAASPETYSGIRSQAAQAASDALSAGMVFYESARFLLLFFGIAMICFFGIVLAEALKQVPADVLVDSQGVDSLRRRAAHLAARLSRRLDPEGNPEVVHQQEVLPNGEPPIEFAAADPAGKEEELVRQEHQV